MENGVPPQVVWEILSPSNDAADMASKHRFYEQYGVEEYYVYDPERYTFEAYERDTQTGRPEWREVPADGFVSPRLGIRLDPSAGELVIYRPDGERFKTYREIRDERNAALLELTRVREIAENEYEGRRRAEQRGERAERVAIDAQAQAMDAQAQAADARAQAADAQAQTQAARERADRLAVLLRAAGIETGE